MSTSQRAFRGMPDRLYPLPTLKVSGTSFARPPAHSGALWQIFRVPLLGQGTAPAYLLPANRSGPSASNVLTVDLGGERSRVGYGRVHTLCRGVATSGDGQQLS